MTSRISLEPGEKLIFEDELPAKDDFTKPFVFGVTDRSVHFLREKHFAKESWQLERIPLSCVVQVFLKKERRMRVILLSILMVAFGGISSVIMMLNVYRELPETKIGPAPFLFLVAGILLPVLSKGRKILVVQTKDKLYKWKPQIGLASYPRDRIEQFQQNAVAACRQAGIHVMRGQE